MGTVECWSYSGTVNGRGGLLKLKASFFWAFKVGTGRGVLLVPSAPTTQKNTSVHRRSGGIMFLGYRDNVLDCRNNVFGL